MAKNPDQSSDCGAVVVMNPRAGGGKVARFRLVERAQAAGAQVRLTTPDQDPASLAAAAIAEGAATARCRRCRRWPPRRAGRSW